MNTLRVVPILCAAYLMAAVVEADEGRLVVHEWGVMWVGHYQGGPALGATDEYLASLPAFVMRNEEISPTTLNQQQFHSVWKPVIHLYGSEGQQVEITVRMPDGVPVVYYPMPKLNKATSPNLPGGISRGGRGIHSYSYTESISWNVTLSKKAPVRLPRAPDGHWWHDSRRIPSDYVSTADGAVERFLFYEGTTQRSPKVTATVTEDAISVTNTDAEISSPIILLINDGGQIRGCYMEPIGSGADRLLGEEDLKPWDEETLLQNCRKHWRSCGMTEDEAEGIVAVWRKELLNTSGFLMISKIPDSEYEKIYPITINPKPAELVRACMVFDTLPLQAARHAWLPELAKKSRATIAKLSERKFIERMRARADLVSCGELMIPYVEEALAMDGNRSDADLIMILNQLKGQLGESPVCAKPAPVQIQGGGIPFSGDISESFILPVDGALVPAPAIPRR